MSPLYWLYHFSHVTEAQSCFQEARYPVYTHNIKRVVRPKYNQRATLCAGNSTTQTDAMVEEGPASNLLGTITQQVTAHKTNAFTRRNITFS